MYLVAGGRGDIEGVLPIVAVPGLGVQRVTHRLELRQREVRRQHMVLHRPELLLAR